MGCFHSNSSARLYPDDDSESPSSSGKYVHYLTETTFQWRLVLYNLITKRFITLKFGNEILAPACESVVVGRLLFCAGGMDRSKKGLASKQLKAIDFKKKNIQTRNLPSMKYPRCKHAFTNLNNNLLCAIGGFEQENAVLSTCEIYDIFNNTWQSGGNLNYPRVAPAACTFSGRFIFVFGGRIKSKCIEADPYFIECMDFCDQRKVWNIIKYEGEYVHPNPCKLWCTQISAKDIILFGSEKTTIFDTRSGKLHVEEKEESAQRHVPDKRGEIKTDGEEVSMILEAGGNVGIYSLKEKKWRIQPHIILGL